MQSVLVEVPRKYAEAISSLLRGSSCLPYKVLNSSLDTKRCNQNGDHITFLEPLLHIPLIRRRRRLACDRC